MKNLKVDYYQHGTLVQQNIIHLMTAPSGTSVLFPRNLEHRDLREIKQIFPEGAVIKCFVI